MPTGARGVESLPVAVLLGAVMGAAVLAIGAACIDQARRLSERQRAIDGFSLLIERIRLSGAGGIGNAQMVELDLAGYEILVRGEILQLVRGEEVIRSDILPLPVFTPLSRLTSGSYVIRLERGMNGGCFLELEAA